METTRVWSPPGCLHGAPHFAPTDGVNNMISLFFRWLWLSLVLRSQSSEASLDVSVQSDEEVRGRGRRSLGLGSRADRGQDTDEVPTASAHSETDHCGMRIGMHLDISVR
jgi:hypothetical protein